jgi:hypothetical protein
MSIADLERPVSRASRSHAPDRCPPTSRRGERRLQSVTPFVVDDGCDVRLRGGRRADVVRVALLEWLPLARADLAVYESGLSSEVPESALASLVRPPTIWTTAEALLAARLVGRAVGLEQGRFAALREHAFTRLGAAELIRLRGVAERFARQLPVEGLPRASATLATGCAAVASDDETCAAVAATQLARYATSAFVARSRIEAAPTMI